MVDRGAMIGQTTPRALHGHVIGARRSSPAAAPPPPTAAAGRQKQQDGENQTPEKQCYQLFLARLPGSKAGSSECHARKWQTQGIEQARVTGWRQLRRRSRGADRE